MLVSPNRLEHTVRTLTEEIGVRLAGSPEEARAAEALASEFRAVTDDVRIERFPVLQRVVRSENYAVRTAGVWRAFRASLFNSAPGTAGETREAELVFFDTATGYRNPNLGHLRGKAVVHLGCHIESGENYRRLMEAQPAFLLFVDTRYPGNAALADGLFPAYVKKYGAIPSVNVAYLDAWNWKVSGADSVRIAIDSELAPSETTVVAAELAGTCPAEGILFAGGHHDTQAGTVGADDNAIGSAAVTELARVLARRPHRRTVRLLSFGAEEQLSAGSAAYVRRHRSELETRGLFMCNFDTFGSAMGWADFTVNATDALRDRIREVFHSRGLYFAEHTEPVPYTDQFPFAACGVPGMWIFRKNCDAGVFYHHRHDADAGKLDFSIAAEHVAAAAELLSQLADVRDFSPYRGIPAAMRPGIDTLFQTVFGGF